LFDHVSISIRSENERLWNVGGLAFFTEA